MAEVVDVDVAPAASVVAITGSQVTAVVVAAAAMADETLGMAEEAMAEEAMVVVEEDMAVVTAVVVDTEEAEEETSVARRGNRTTPIPFNVEVALQIPHQSHSSPVCSLKSVSLHVHKHTHTHTHARTHQEEIQKR